MRCRLCLSLFASLLGLSAVGPTLAGVINITCYSASGAATATYAHPPSPYLTEELALVDMSRPLIPPSGSSTATMDLTATPGSGGDMFVSGLIAQAGGSNGFTTRDFATTASITSRTIKVTYDWVPNMIYDPTTYTVGPDPNDTPPAEIYAALLYDLSGTSSAEGSYSYDYSTYPNITMFNGSASASGSVTVDGQTLSIPTASSQYPAPADSHTATLSFAKAVPQDFTSGHAELSISVSATAMVQGTKAAKAGIGTSGSIIAAAVYLDSPNPKVDPTNPHATLARDPENNEYTFIDAVDANNLPSSKVLVSCLAKVTKPTKASQVLQRLKVKFLSDGFAATFSTPTADDQGNITSIGTFFSLPLDNNFFKGPFKIKLSVDGKTSDKNTATI